ncbi:hypothetical protein QH494_17010 [Sphingomonas sp. AR_OL41]|uniref:hypothetical protein n=1 Tax=Sphingomonas sp. AR_OL41 TaxID=3042729 RepID=UPI002480F7F4|nr:hypothetical protein [Sphingomonas sp. AR_OL41]MDH7973893.1 hypothetical protein [Sphingomonas sp. AR_OL41]
MTSVFATASSSRITRLDADISAVQANAVAQGSAEQVGRISSTVEIVTLDEDPKPNPIHSMIVPKSTQLCSRLVKDAAADRVAAVTFNRVV